MEIERCPNCGLKISSAEHAFCLKCGADLHRGGIKMECCNRVIVDPWAKEFGYIPFCPHCGKRTGQVPPAQIKAKIEARKQKWHEDEEQRKRALDPPLLTGVKIKVRPDGTGLIKDLLEELNHYDRYPVVIADSVDQARTLFKAFTENAKRLSTTEAQLVIDVPTQEKRDLIDDRFQHRSPVFTTVGLLPSLSLKYANRFFMVVENIGDTLLKALGRLSSWAYNKSTDPVFFEYHADWLQERLARYREEEAEIIIGGEEGDE